MKISRIAVFVCFVFSSFPLHAQELVSLEQVIALALEANYDIRLAKFSQESTATDKRYAPVALAPQINGTGAIAWNNNQQELRFQDASRNNSGEAKSQNLNASVQLNWILFDGTKMFASLDRINTIAAQGELLVKEQMVNTIAQVISNYYNIVRQKQQLRATQEQMGVNEERVKLAEKKLQVGTGGKPELLQARVDYNAQRTQVILQEASIVQLKEQLNALVDSKLPIPFDVADSIELNMDLKEKELEEQAGVSNYSLQAYRLDIETARLSLWERKAELSPVITFNSAYNFSETDNTKLINPFGPMFNQTKGFNYGFGVTIPIFNGLNTRRQIQQASISYSRSQTFYNQQKLQVSVAVRNAYVSYDNAKKILLIEEENILLAKENVFIALEGFKRGVTTSIELITAQQSLADAYNRLINARYLAKVAETELLRLNGSLLK